MRVLAIDTALAACSAAVLDTEHGGGIVASESLPMVRGNAEALLPLLQRVMGAAGLTFADIRLIKDTHDGVPVLVVEGSIDSAARVPVEVPRLRFAVRNAAGAEVYAWTAQPPQPTLAPGENMAFRSRLAAPPKDAHDVVVRFFTHRDAVAGLR